MFVAGCDGFSCQLAGELLFWSNWDSHQNGGKYNHEQGLGRNRYG